jgi:hypothetical protein
MDNPVTRQITLPLRYQANFDEGPYQATRDALLLNQAVLPFALNDDWALITRTRLLWQDVPPRKLQGDWESGVANGYTTFFLSPAKGNGFFWGAGPVLYYPGQSNVGVDKWGSGPSVAVLSKDGGPWVFGAVVNNIWTFDQPSNSSDRTNRLMLNPFISYHFGDGWSVGSSPSIAANWIARGNKWTVPTGGGVSKAFRIGDQPIKFGINAFYNAIRPKAASDTWLLQATLTLSFPK